MKFETVHDVARHVLEQSEDRKKQIAAMVEIVRADPALLLAITEDHLSQICGQFLSTVVNTRRRSIVRQARAETKAGDQAGRRLVNSTTTLLDWVLICGTPMARADHKKLRTSAQHYKSNGATMTGHGNWLALVANNLPKGKMVGQTFNHRELKHMWDKTHANA